MVKTPAVNRGKEVPFPAGRQTGRIIIAFVSSVQATGTERPGKSDFLILPTKQQEACALGPARPSGGPPRRKFDLRNWEL